MSTTTEPRRELVFDGKGINGPDQYRERVATFTSDEAAKKYGPLFEAVPELVEIVRAYGVLLNMSDCEHVDFVDSSGDVIEALYCKEHKVRELLAVIDKLQK